MKRLGTLSFLAVPLLAANLALANPIVPPPSGGANGGSGGAVAADGGTNNGSDSGCSLVGSRLARRLGPWVIAGAFSVTYLFVRRRPRR
jgi:hypothetical protein